MSLNEQLWDDKREVEEKENTLLDELHHKANLMHSTLDELERVKKHLANSDQLKQKLMAWKMLELLIIIKIKTLDYVSAIRSVSKKS